MQDIEQRPHYLPEKQNSTLAEVRAFSHVIFAVLWSDLTAVKWMINHPAPQEVGHSSWMYNDVWCLFLIQKNQFPKGLNCFLGVRSILWPIALVWRPQPEFLS